MSDSATPTGVRGSVLIGTAALAVGGACGAFVAADKLEGDPRFYAATIVGAIAVLRMIRAGRVRAGLQPQLAAMVVVPSAVAYVGSLCASDLDKLSTLFTTSAQVLSALLIAMAIERRLGSDEAGARVGERPDVLFMCAGLLASLVGTRPDLPVEASGACFALAASALAGLVASVVAMLPAADLTGTHQVGGQ